MSPKEALALVPVEHPRNDPAKTAPTKESVNQAVGRLAARMRERTLAKMMAEELEAKAVAAMVEILEQGENKEKLEIIKLLWAQIPGAPKESGVEQLPAGTVIGIKIGGALQRGRKEFA